MLGDLLAGLMPAGATGGVERVPAPAGVEVWWRVRQQQRVGLLSGDGGMSSPSTTHIVLQPFTVLRHTPKGVWLDAARWTEDGWAPRFVLARTKRKFACATQAQALRSFAKRKQAQRRLLRMQIERSKVAEELAWRELVRVTAKEGDE